MVLAASRRRQGRAVHVRRRRRRRARRSSSDASRDGPARDGPLRCARPRAAVGALRLPAARAARRRLRPGARALPWPSAGRAREVAALRHARRRAAPGRGLLPRGGAGRRRRASLWSKGEAELSLTWPDVAPARRGRGPGAVPRREGPGGRGAASTARRVGALRAQRRPPPLRGRAARGRAAGGRQPAALRVRGHGLARRREPRQRRPAPARGRVLQPGRRRRGRRRASTTCSRRDAPRPFARQPRRRRARARAGRPQRRALRGAPARAAPSCASRPSCTRGARAAAASALVPGDAGGRGRARSASCGPRVLGAARSPAPREVAVRAARRARATIVRLGLHVGGAADARFAWGVWRRRASWARGGADAAAAAPPRAARTSGAASALRAGAARARTSLLVVLDAARAEQLRRLRLRARRPRRRSTASPREGVVFERAYTPAVYTLGAMSSVWTSQYPDRHHGEVSFSARLPDGPPDPGRAALGARGIHTAGFVANAMAGTRLRLRPRLLRVPRGLRATQSAAGARRVPPACCPPGCDAQRGRRFFAYLHFREPHFPYDPPPPFDTRFGPDGPIRQGGAPRPRPGSRT